jgi:hypothetical protein
LDPSTGLLLTGGSNISVGKQDTLEGFSFVPGQTIDITIDTPQGTHVGYATAKDGTFTGSFTIPSVPSGPHTLVASSNGQTLATSVSVNIEQPIK